MAIREIIQLCPAPPGAVAHYDGSPESEPIFALALIESWSCSEYERGCGRCLRASQCGYLVEAETLIEPVMDGGGYFEAGSDVDLVAFGYLP
jgi:hypothetical protein